MSRISLEARVLDLEAIVEAVAPGQPIALYAVHNSGHVAIAYAARRPHRVSHLALAGCSPRGTDFFPPQVQALLPMIGRDLEFYIDTMVNLTLESRVE